MTNTQAVQSLFRPFTLGKLSLSNRTVMAPMTRQKSPNGVPGSDVAAYYRRRAENGVGLIITEGTVINDADSSNQKDVPFFYGEEALNGWANVVSEVHDAGGKIAPQIWHMGARGNVNEYTEEEIAHIVQEFANSAASAKRLGFDGIELHGAHGYLIDQFFWAKTNQRTDRYGGSLIARTTFAAEVVKACREAVGPDFPIILRISQWKGIDYSAKLVETAEELKQFLEPLVNAGVDIFHCSTRRFWEPEFEGSDLNFAGWVKQLTGKPTITVGSVGLEGDVTTFFSAGSGSGNASLDGLIPKLENQEFDLVAIGRALLADPAWVSKIRDGRVEELIPFSPQSVQTLY
ncbi:NADH:flavin oxidoreductase [Paenibacillus paeoniae]|uniref:12-oxophytodienoate reductase n=1 Tax=Paenibacillus paeoniae TaxID=2292705 RepID=A0A371PKZ8_9BACL|nr:NADH:flavin oxidoreductase [Paenibacillus paeoniae]REK76884.1 12-oxophytodienoate reductase [Paenibacillus paeoniae]